MSRDHIINSINHHELVSDSTLHVVAVVSNPVRYHSRYRLFRKFVASMRTTANVKLHVVELAFGDRHFEIEAGVDSILRLRSSHELWLKENMINLGVRHLLPADWRYVAWVDGDVAFQSDNWALETIHALQHHDVVQPWSQCVDMGPQGNALQMFNSFGSLNAAGTRIQRYSTEPYKFGHTGYAWACTRTFWENVGGLMDWPILGSSDHHMAFAMINEVDYSVHGKMTEAFKRKAREWQRDAYRVTSGHIGYVPGLLHHAWHGSKTKRGYRTRWQILIDNQFDPDVDLRRDAQGLLFIVNKPHLEEDVRKYFRSRHEDGIEE